METIDIKVLPLLFSFLLLTVPIYLSHVFKIGFIRSLLYSVVRMAVQLFLIGIFLKYLFRLNNPYANIAWLVVMILVAVFSAIRNSSLKAGKVLVPAFVSFTIVTLAIVLYLNGVIIRMKNIFDARYLIVLGGMLLGSSLRGNIIGISSFYKNIRKDSKRFLYILSLGATRHEAVLPFLRESVQLAVRPTLASMATMGIVALPGMMTGVIMGGASPEVAIKYQIMIML
ncbi:ABC transporter permease, partial [bacterium]